MSTYSSTSKTESNNLDGSCARSGGHVVSGGKHVGRSLQFSRIGIVCDFIILGEYLKPSSDRGVTRIEELGHVSTCCILTERYVAFLDIMATCI